MAELTEAEEIARRRRVVTGAGTDHARWTDPTSYEAFWSDRASSAGALCGARRWVCDIGCGALQSLRRFLPDGTVYLPADLRRWTPDVEVCDINARNFPTTYLRACDTVYLLGVIEYINDVPALFAQLIAYAQSIVVSYNCADFADVDRAGYGWVNAFTSDGLESMLQHAGWSLVNTRRVGTMEYVVEARGGQFGAVSRARRSVARLGLKNRHLIRHPKSLPEQP